MAMKAAQSKIPVVEVPPELKGRVNNVKNRILFLPPSVMNGEERECRRDDFESLSNKNIGRWMQRFGHQLQTPAV